MAEVKEDRRIKRTKRQLSAGLIELMKKKNIKDITIKELVEKVDINRSTFYLHYSDIYDLLNDIEKNLMEEVTSVFNSYKNIEQLEDSYAFLLTLFKTFDNNRELCKILMNNPNSRCWHSWSGGNLAGCKMPHEEKRFCPVSGGFGIPAKSRLDL